MGIGGSLLQGDIVLQQLGPEEILGEPDLSKVIEWAGIHMDSDFCTVCLQIHQYLAAADFCPGIAKGQCLIEEFTFCSLIFGMDKCGTGLLEVLLYILLENRAAGPFSCPLDILFGDFNRGTFINRVGGPPLFSGVISGSL